MDEQDQSIEPARHEEKLWLQNAKTGERAAQNTVITHLFR
jgi:hypothetical protein